VPLALSTPESTKRVHFRLKRLQILLSAILRNKLGLLGLFFLVGSILAAAAAPLLVYTSGDVVVSGTLAQPSWAMNFPDGYRLSKNIVVLSDQDLNTPSSLQAWSVSGSPATLSSLVVSYASGISPPTSMARGSIQLAYAGAGPATVIVSKTFNYPYHGPPESFAATFQAMALGVNPSQPVRLVASINRVGDQLFTLFEQNVTANGSWTGATSLTSGTMTIPGVAGNQITVPVSASAIFSSAQDYSYQIALTFHGSQKVYLGDIQFNTLGTAWGLFGTDYRGADVWTQLVYGARISLLVGLSASALGIGIGLIVGLVAGFLGSLIDEVLMRFTDMILVIPFLPLLIVLVAILGANIYNIILVIGLFGWMGFARVIRAQVLTLKERRFVEAARAAGAGPSRIMRTHIFPNIVSLTYVNLALTVPGAILTEAALEFLGLGDPSLLSWGHMFFLAEQNDALNAWWWILPPGIAIAIVSISFVLIGYALDEIFNPRLRRRQ
jgi:ABC-type dipeptide/oligopeptide/nickel transport system permease subunit